MLKDFHKLNPPFNSIEHEDGLDRWLQSADSLKNLAYFPDNLTDKAIYGVVFQNFSFAKTVISNCAFRNCTFEDCLFIGTEFNHCAFHQCRFLNCNFNHSRIRNTYAKPKQFRKAITSKKFANIGVKLYQELRHNYYAEAQKEFANESEYFFRKWLKHQNLYEARQSTKKFNSTYVIFIVSLANEILFGYGFRLRNLFCTATVSIVGITVLNHEFCSLLYPGRNNPTWIESAYVSITTMSTLGAAGYSDLSELGYLITIASVLIGLTLFASTLNLLIKKVSG